MGNIVIYGFSVNLAKGSHFCLRKNVRAKRDAGCLKMVVRNVRNIVIYGLSVNLTKGDDFWMRKNVRVNWDGI